MNEEMSAQEISQVEDLPTMDESENSQHSVVNEPITNPLLKFFDGLGDSFSSDVLSSQFRFTRTGMFFTEDLLEQILETYKAWKISEGATNVESEKKLYKHLFNSEYPLLNYLLDGKLCLVGYFVETTLDPNHKYPAKFIPGGPTSALNMIHFKDTTLASIAKVEPVVDKAGFRLFVEAKKRKYSITPPVLSIFGEVIRGIRRFEKRNPEINQSLRATIPVLVRSLEHAKLVSFKHSFLIPAQYYKAKDMKLLRAGEVIFVLDKEDAILGCYGLKGRAFHNLLTSEFNALRMRYRKKKLGAFQFGFINQRFLGTIFIDRSKLLLKPVVFKEFIEQLYFSKEFRRAFRRWFTIQDCLLHLVDILERAHNVEQKEIPRYIRLEKTKGCRYITTDEWLFVIASKNTIVNCFCKTKHKQASAKLERGHRKSEAEPGAKTSQMNPS